MFAVRGSHRTTGAVLRTPWRSGMGWLPQHCWIEILGVRSFKGGGRSFHGGPEAQASGPGVWYRRTNPSKSGRVALHQMCVRASRELWTVMWERPGTCLAPDPVG